MDEVGAILKLVALAKNVIFRTHEADAQPGRNRQAHVTRKMICIIAHLLAVALVARREALFVHFHVHARALRRQLPT